MIESNQNALFPELEAEKSSQLAMRAELDELRNHVFEAKTSYLPQYAFAIAALVAVGLLALWLNTRNQAVDMEKKLSVKLAEFNVTSLANNTLAKQVDERSHASSGRIAVLEQQLADAKSQQVSLQTLYNALANTREEQAIGEVEQLLLIASQQMQLAGNVRPAILALQTADNRLQPYSNAAITQIRLAISQDIGRLQATPLVDLLSLNAQLESVISNIDELKMVSERTQTFTQKNNDQPIKKQTVIAQLAAEIWHDIKDMVKVERIDRPEPPLLSPGQQYFMRENLKLRLLAARISLLQHDDASFKKDLNAAINSLNIYFDMRDPLSQKTLKQLQALSREDLSIATPDISTSLNLVTRHKLSLENTVLQKIVPAPYIPLTGRANLAPRKLGDKP